MKNNKYNAFTLVELIIVIAIIATLSVIAVMTITEWLWKSRDTRRIEDISSISKSLELAYVKSSEMPLPDSYTSINDENGALAWYQWEFSDWAASKTSIKSTPQDPNWWYYEYSLASDKSTYQLKTELENWTKISYFTNKTYAASTDKLIKVDWNFKWLLVTNSWSSYYLWDVWSMFMDKTATSSNWLVLSTNNTWLVITPEKKKSEKYKPKSVNISTLYDDDKNNDDVAIGLITNGLWDKFKDKSEVVSKLTMVKNLSTSTTTTPKYRLVDTMWPFNHYCALKSDNSLWCWGNNSNWQLGQWNTWTYLTPVQVPINNIKDVKMWNSLLVVLKNDWTVWTWGIWWSNRLGLGDTNDRMTPTQITWLNNITKIEIAAFGWLAYKSDGTVRWRWNNSAWILWVAAWSYASPVQLTIPSSYKFINFSSLISLAYKSDWTLWWWGNNNVDQLQLWNTWVITTPTQLTNIPPFQKFIAVSQAILLKSDWTILAWGNNSYGHLGLWDTTNRSTPTLIPNFTWVVDIFPVNVSTFAVKSDWTVRAWWDNTWWKLWLWDTVQRNSPTLMTGINDVIKIVWWNWSVCAQKKDASIRCWWDNSSWAFWNWTTTSNNLPNKVNDF